MTGAPRARAAAGPKPLPFAEFVTLLAVLISAAAFSIDAMLPALPQIAGDLGLADVNRAQLILSLFMLGMGLGTLMMGPLSDAIGRKSTITLGIGIYMAGALAAYFATSFEVMLAARFLQGFGISAPRVTSVALVRDLYSGRQMARVMSFVMTVFVLVPAVAPLVGQGMVAGFGWRSIFLVFLGFGIVGAVWLNLRLPETLPPEARRPISAGRLWSALGEIARSRVVVVYTITVGFGFGQMMAYINSAAQIFTVTFDTGAAFPLYFAGIAILSGSAGIVNAMLVVRLGMRRLALAAYLGQAAFSAAMVAVTALGLWPEALYFPAFLLWSVSIFFMAGLTFGNLNALAMEPMGHIAGLASAVIGAVSTVIGALLAIPIGLAFDGTPLPLMLGVLTCTAIAIGLMLTNPKGR